MKNPNSWDKSDLHHHLQHALQLELWTIPLYLTALYSIKDLYKIRHHAYPEAAKLIFSVVIQEMLHLELVCNLTNALGFSPKFTMPSYDEKTGIPFIHPSHGNLPRHLQGYSVRPQALNEESLRLFCAIELPHPKTNITWEEQNTYHSIAELYEALKVGVTALWKECYVGDDKNTKQKNTFTEYHNQEGKNHGFSQVVTSLDSAMKAIDAIIEQGEGADSHHVPADFRPLPIKEGREYDTADYKGHLSHYQKFRILMNAYHHLPDVYRVDADAIDLSAQHEMEKVFTGFLSEMELHFNGEGESFPDSFWLQMHSLGPAIGKVWESGRCPEFLP
jgi:Ferritin-like